MHTLFSSLYVTHPLYEDISFLARIRYLEIFLSLQNPYKSQCSYYDTNQNPFNSVSREDCFHKCLETNCFIYIIISLFCLLVCVSDRL